MPKELDKVSIVGLGKLGQCWAACFAQQGFNTLGVDADQNVVDSINNGRPSVAEPGVEDVISNAGRMLRATTSYSDAINETDVTFILVPTPSDTYGEFSNRYVESALRSLAVALKESHKEYHLFIINSTVMPGSIEDVLIPLVETTSSRKVNEGFGICYWPELVALGSVMRDFLNPDFVMIGTNDSKAGDAAVDICKRLCVNNPPVFQMSIIDTEIAKVSLNCYITMKISFANALANLCEKVKGADSDAVSKALGADRRISPHYLRGGLSYGGTCFPRDTQAFVAFARRSGIEEGADLMRAVESINDYQDRHLAETVFEQIEAANAKGASILGLSFKPGTPVIEESPAIKLIQKLVNQGMNVSVYDPLAMNNAKIMFGDSLEYASSMRDCLSSSNVWVITTTEAEFRSIDSSFISVDPTVVIDCWRILEKSTLGPGVKYFALGRYHTD